MQDINSLLDKALKPHSDASQTEAGPSKAERADRTQHSGPDLVDAINQLFAEFELAYHNQYHKAYADPDRLVMTKKFWLECLADFHPQQLVAAARYLVKTQDYMPTVSAVIRACEQAYGLYGLPSEREAYTEACRAPAPKLSHSWSHPAVYHAGKATDWFMLSSEPEEKVFPVFCYYYRQLCQRVLRGEELSMPVPPALAHNPPRPLTHEERAQRLQNMRSTLGI